MTTGTPEYVAGAGASLVSRRILDGSGRLKWAFREPSANPSDNGWRFFSDADDDSTINAPGGVVVSDFNRLADLEPAVIGIYPLPVGSDLQLVIEGGHRWFVDNATGARI